MSQHSSTVRAALRRAGDRYVETLRGITAAQWEQPNALGEWTVRELAAHTLRAFTTIETYLGTPVDETEPTSDAVQYYRLALGLPSIHAAVAERGRAAGKEFTDPVVQASEVLERVLALVAATDDDVLVGGPGGVLAFPQYLKTRVVELTLHTLDLQRATGQPTDLDADAVEIVLAIAASLAEPVALLSALTGRGELVGVNVFA